MRDAPALDIIPALQEAGAAIRAFDPESMHEAGKLLTGVTFCDGPYHAIEGADAMVIITEWDQFRALDLDRVRATLRSPIVVDLRNVYQPAEMIRRGFIYESVGRPQPSA
jgi:UDPglucose 6-dehydrogenase